MPNINLRLTNEQHAELTAWAHDGRRSLQKEIIWRLFTGAPKVTIEPLPQMTQRVAVTHTPPANLPVADDPHFKPDFGGKIK